MGKWRKGRSGNPGGRPALYREFVEWARYRVQQPEFRAEIDALIKQSRSLRSKGFALQLVLEYAIGKPAPIVASMAEGQTALYKATFVDVFDSPDVPGELG